MSNRKFKTNINCNNCISTVTPHLDKIEGIKKWEVDIDSEEKVLSVETDRNSKIQIMDAVKAAGFEIEPIKQSFLGKFFG